MTSGTDGGAGVQWGWERQITRGTGIHFNTCLERDVSCGSEPLPRLLCMPAISPHRNDPIRTGAREGKLELLELGKGSLWLGGQVQESAGRRLGSQARAPGGG